MNDAEAAIKNIATSLRPGGIFLSLTPLENHELFEMRDKFIKNSRWKSEFNPEKFELHPFHDSLKFYTG